jgi:hypothetical protein
MSSVQSYIKQQNILYGALPVSGGAVHLNTFTPDASTNPNSVVGSFSDAAITFTDTSANITPIFRDMGQVIVSANRTFRRVQLLTNIPATFGVGGVSTGNGPYRTYWHEVSLYNGQGVVNSLFQVRG